MLWFYGWRPLLFLGLFQIKVPRHVEDFWQIQRLPRTIVENNNHSNSWLLNTGGNTQRICCLGYTSYRVKMITLYHSWNTWNASLCQWSLEEAYPIYVEIVVTSAKQFPNILTESSWFYISINLRCCNEAQKFVLFLFFWGNKKCRV